MLTVQDKKELIMIYDGIAELKESLSSLMGLDTAGYERNTALGKMEMIWNIIYRNSIFYHEDRDMTIEEYQELENILDNRNTDVDTRILKIFN